MNKASYFNGFAATAGTETVEIPVIDVEAGEGSRWQPGAPQRPTPAALDDEVTEATPPNFPLKRGGPA